MEKNDLLTDLAGKLTTINDWSDYNTNNSVIYTDHLLATSPGANYYSNLSTDLSIGSFSPENILEIINSGFETYGFEFNEIHSIQEKETSQDILGWVSVGFLENKYCGNLLIPWLSLASSYVLPKSIILTVKEDSYFENFSVKILLNNNLVLIDSSSELS